MSTLCSGNGLVPDFYLAHWGLVPPYCDTDLVQHWFRCNGLLSEGTKQLPESMLIFICKFPWHSSEGFTKRRSDDQLNRKVNVPFHVGTTEEGKYSYLLPNITAGESSGVDKGQISCVIVAQIAYRTVVTRLKFLKDAGILVLFAYFWEIWRFKFSRGRRQISTISTIRGKEGYWRWIGMLLHIHWK